MAISRSDLERSLAELAAEVVEPAYGIFGPASTAWRIGGNLEVFLGGGRAALLQLAHPKVAYAIEDHSHTRADVGGRFQRTFSSVFAMVFGHLDDALRAARRVHAVHTHIHGTLPIAIGSWRAGTPYEANDPVTQRWVHATLIDTVLTVRERLGGALPAHDKDAFIREHRRFAKLFAIPPAICANSYAEHADYMAHMLRSGELAVAPCAREMARFLVGRGGRGAQPMLGRVSEMLTAELLPRALAEQFALVRSPRAAQRMFAALAPITRLPRAWRAIPARAQAQRRIARRPPSRLAARAEALLFRLARKTTGP